MHRCGSKQEQLTAPVAKPTTQVATKAIPSSSQPPKIKTPPQDTRPGKSNTIPRNKPSPPPSSVKNDKFSPCGFCHHIFPTSTIGKHLHECLSKGATILRKAELKGLATPPARASQDSTKRPSSTPSPKKKSSIPAKLPVYPIRSDNRSAAPNHRIPPLKGEKPRRPEDIERRLDGSHGNGNSFRDGGLYGSYASHDNYNEESDP
jgi:hypothetical protein